MDKTITLRERGVMRTSHQRAIPILTVASREEGEMLMTTVCSLGRQADPETHKHWYRVDSGDFTHLAVPLLEYKDLEPVAEHLHDILQRLRGD